MKTVQKSVVESMSDSKSDIKDLGSTRSKSMIKDATLKLRKWKRTLEIFIEDPGVIILFLLMAYVDILLGSLSLSSTQDGVQKIESLRNIILFSQCFELLLQMSIFHARFFSHWGYCYDTILMVTRILNGSQFQLLQTNPQHLHILSFLRIWRFVRIVQTYVGIEVSEHGQTKKELASQIKSKDEWKEKATLIREDVEREKRLSKQNQGMVKVCREEIDTLREALKIAALDVAAMRKQIDSTYQGGNNDLDDLGIDVVENNINDEDDGIEDKA